jgi:hypothetical protein
LKYRKRKERRAVNWVSGKKVMLVQVFYMYNFETTRRQFNLFDSLINKK